MSNKTTSQCTSLWFTRQLAHQESLIRSYLRIHLYEAWSGLLVGWTSELRAKKIERVLGERKSPLYFLRSFLLFWSARPNCLAHNWQADSWLINISFYRNELCSPIARWQVKVQFRAEARFNGLYLLLLSLSAYPGYQTLSLHDFRFRLRSRRWRSLFGQSRSYLMHVRKKNSGTQDSLRNLSTRHFYHRY